jgi:hypothetical protein
MLNRAEHLHKSCWKHYFRCSRLAASCSADRPSYRQVVGLFDRGYGYTVVRQPRVLAMSKEQVYCARTPGGTVCPNSERCREIRTFVLSKTEEPLQTEARERIAELKAGSGVLRQAVVNFDAEKLLSCRFWRNLFKMIAPVEKKASKVRDAVREYVRSVRFQGPKAKVSPSTVFGRVTTREDLKSYFVKNGYLPDDLSAMLNIDEVMKVPVDEGRAKWGSYELGKYVMWSTFDPAGGRPFDSAGKDAKKLRGRLGLDRSTRNPQVLVVEYTLPSDVDAYLPTVAEAYASDPWISYFRPLGEEEEKQGYGMTQPTEEYESEPGMPEVVHQPVRGNALAYPPEEFS